MRTQEWAIGVDIGGTSTKFGIVNHRGEIFSPGRLLLTQQFTEPQTFVEALYNALNPVFSKIGAENFKGIGVGAPNGNISNGHIEYAPNLPWEGSIPLAEMISNRFGIPCRLTNDANAAAIGEMMYGCARGMKDFIMLTLGTGVGSAIVSNGLLISGNRGIAGELGHTFIRKGRVHWSSGMDGTLETYASATGIVNTFKILMETKATESLLSDYSLNDITSEMICKYALKGDSLCREVFEFTGQILGEAIANFVMFSDPQAIVLFGGVTKAGNLLVDPIIKNMEKNLMPIFRNSVEIFISELPDADAAILGASALVWDNIPDN